MFQSKPMQWLILQTLVLTTVLLGGTTCWAITDALWLWFDDENVSSCDDPFVEEDLTCWLTSTTQDDCDDGGAGGICTWAWSEGVIYLNTARLIVDLTPLAAVDSVQVFYWDAMAEDMRVFLYNDDLIVDEAQGDWYGSMLTVRTGGAQVDRLALSACEGELYEVAVFVGDGLSGVTADYSQKLAAPYPNPFNPRCTLAFELSEPATVSLRVFNLKGQLVKTLIESVDLPDRRHSRIWNGDDNQGRNVAGGVYLARLELNGQQYQRRLVLVR